MFKPEHQAAIMKLADESILTVLEANIEGQERKLDVTLTGFAQGSGLAFFEAEGEPY